MSWRRWIRPSYPGFVYPASAHRPPATSFESTREQSVSFRSDVPDLWIGYRCSGYADLSLADEAFESLELALDQAEDLSLIPAGALVRKLSSEKPAQRVTRDCARK